MAIGDPKTQSKMDKEIAALRRQHRAGKLTDFKLRQGIKKIKEKYGKAEPSTVSKVMSFLKKTPAEAGLFTPSPRSAKARAKAKETSKKTTVSDAQKRRQIASGSSRTTTVSDAQKKRQTMKLPKSPPKRLKNNLDKPTSKPKSKPTKKSEKMYHQINVQTGKVDFNKPKVTAAQRLKQEDKHKAFKKLNKAAKESLKKKGK
jgi:hypothetical protein